eukprot:143988-Pyramimonas_sp.AAC.1
MLTCLCHAIADASLCPHLDPCLFFHWAPVGGCAAPCELASSCIASACVYVSGILRITIAPVALP